jgi:catecholate siderophore receptor
MYMQISCKISQCVLFGLCWACLGPLKAQAIRGVVVDPARAPIPNAQVQSGGTAVRTDDSGEFLLEAAPGEAVLKAAAEGFEERSLKVTVPEAGEARVEVALALASMRLSVTVTESGYRTAAVESALRSKAALGDIPQSLSIVNREQIHDQLMASIGDVVRYIPGITAHQGENNRDQVIIRGNNSSADFFVNGVRDDVQYYRDLYNLEEVQALKGPNAMAFGRGGGGGVINRVTKEAFAMPVGEFMLQGGSFGYKRASGDWNQPVSAKFAARLNAMFEDSSSFRDFVGLRREAANPAITLTPSERMRITASYEFLRDRRVADRGMPSFGGLPVDLPVSTYFGNPNDSRVRANVHLGSAAVEHQAGAWNLRNRTVIGDYDRGYQNYVPGAVTADRLQEAISAYNNATARKNAFNQTDVARAVSTGGLRHGLLMGAELGSQSTDNFRNTGYFGNATSILVPLENPLVSTPAIFRQSAADADNHVQARVAASYAQDQVQIAPWLRLVGGVRFDWFDLRLENHRTAERLRRTDRVVSPRAGLVLKPVQPLSLYASYSVSYLPSAGDQFSSLTSVTQQMKPEQFTNYEIGAKWDVRRSLWLTAAVYRLDRTNTRSVDPNDVTRILQTGRQRSDGVEIEANGRIARFWSVAGGYAYQDARITNATSAAPAGARAAQVPRHGVSLWNRVQLRPRWSAGVGVIRRADMFAAVDNKVTLPGYTRVDAALYYSVTEKIRVQANAENLFDRRYFINADGNNNISPGAPVAVRIGLTVRL